MASKNYSSIHHIIKKHQQASQPISTGSPEHPSSSETTKPAEVQEVVEFEAVDPEVQPHVEVKPEVVKLPPELKKAGVAPVANPQFTTTQGMKLPMPAEELPKGLSAPVDSSFRWLAVLTMYVLEQSHISIKKAHKGILGLFKRY